MNLEGSRKFWVMILGVLALWLTAKFGPTIGGLFNTFLPYLVIGIATGWYYIYNYLQKKTTDVFVPDNWLSGKRIVIGLILSAATPILTKLTTDQADLVTQMFSTIVDVLVPGLFMLFQAKSDIKMATPATSSSTPQLISVGTLVQGLKEVSASQATSEVKTAAKPADAGSLKQDLKMATAITSTWDGAKSYLLGTFKERFEAALRRYASLSMSTVEAARKAVMDVVGVLLDEKTCQAIGQQPGFLGAVSANADISIIADLLAVIDRTPELAYMKTAFMKRATFYARKSVLDEPVKLIQSGDKATVLQALLYCGMSLYQAEKTMPELPYYMWYSTMPDVLGTYSFRPFDVSVLAGVDPSTLEDY